MYKNYTILSLYLIIVRCSFTWPFCICSTCVSRSTRFSLSCFFRINKSIDILINFYSSLSKFSESCFSFCLFALCVSYCILKLFDFSCQIRAIGIVWLFLESFTLMVMARIDSFSISFGCFYCLVKFRSISASLIIQTVSVVMLRRLDD